MNRLTDKERKALMDDIRSFDEQMPCVGVFRYDLPKGVISSNAAWIVQAYENVPLKTHDKSFLHDVPESIYKRHRDEMPPRFARRAEHFYGEHKRVRCLQPYSSLLLALL